MKKRLLCAALCFIMLISVVSCGTPKHKYDPGFFEFTKQNYTSYVTVNISSGHRKLSPATDTVELSYSFKPKKDTVFKDCYVDVSFTVNGTSQTQTITLDNKGNAAGNVVIQLEGMTYEADCSYHIGTVGGSVYEEEGLKDSYVVYNNIRYEYYRYVRDKDLGIRGYWGARYTAKNNTKTLYFSDVLYTESGTAIPAPDIDFFMWGYKNFWTADIPLDKVETFIFDGTMTLSSFLSNRWSNVYHIMPNLKTIYIKEIVDDLEETGLTELKAPTISLPTTGVDFYIGGDTDLVRSLLENTQFVASINESSDFDLSEYDTDNKR